MVDDQCFVLYLRKIMNTWKKEGAFENFLNIIKGWDGFGSFTTCRGSLSFSVITFMKT